MCENINDNENNYKSKKENVYRMCTLKILLYINGGGDDDDCCEKNRPLKYNDFHILKYLSTFQMGKVTLINEISSSFH